MSTINYKEIRAQLNSLHKIMAAAPESEKRWYSLCAGGVLNAYREGDISFDEAVAFFESPLFIHSRAVALGLCQLTDIINEKGLYVN